MLDLFNTPFGTEDFFVRHGYLFLICIAFFPRLTLLFSSVASGGLVWWLGFIFCPRILVAILATLAYFKTNPILVVIAWIVALSGETLEKRKLGGSRFIIRTSRFPYGPQPESERATVKPSTVNDKDTFEAQFTRKS